MSARLKEYFKNTIVGEMRAARGYTNAMQVPKLGKIVLNMGFDVETDRDTLKALVEDLGRELGCGAHVAELRRTQAGPFSLAQAVSLDELLAAHEQGGAEALDRFLLPVDCGLEHWPAVQLSEHSAYYWLHGQPVRAPEAPKFGMLRVRDHQGHFIGIGEVTDDGRVAPRRLIRS